MKLITEKGQLALPEDFSFTVEKESPFFGENGSASIPVTLPTALDTLDKLLHPERLGASETFVRKIKSKLEAGIFHKDGVLIVDTVSSENGITASLALDESEVYANSKDKKLSELFENIIRDDFAQSQNPIADWVDYLVKCAQGEESDDFIIGPVAVNKTETDNIVSYSFLNDVDITSTEEWWPLLYDSRLVQEDQESIQVPLGYGVTPFLFFHRFLDLLMTQIGYTLRMNPFAEHSLMKKIILVNNTADTICIGKIKYADIVPTCTLSEFIEFLNNKFHAQVFIYPEQKIADVVLFESMLDQIDQDISGLLDGKLEITYTDEKQISLEADISLDGAEPAADTYDEFVSNHPVIKSVTEKEFGSSKYSDIYRLALGRYYQVKKNTVTNNAVISHLGTNNFNYCKKTMKTEKFEAADLSVGMISYLKDIAAYPHRPIVAPYIGERRNLNTSYNNKNDIGTEQKIILCYYAGKAESGDGFIAKYSLITTQKYNNLGHAWAERNLNYVDLYDLFWKKYNELLMNAAPAVSGKYDYDVLQLLGLRMDRLKLYKGQKLLPQKISYNVGRDISCNTSEYLVCVDILNPKVDTTPAPAEQLYYWKRYTDLDSTLDKYDNPQVNEVSWEYVENKETVDTNVFMPAPTEEGVKAYSELTQIVVKVRDLFNGSITEHMEWLSSWYQSEKL